jgi:hypothetical protein
MLHTFINALSKLGRDAPTFAEVRKEVFLLGGRHKGQVLEGARLELEAAAPGSRRAGLLQAVIAKEQTA